MSVKVSMMLVCLAALCASALVFAGDFNPSGDSPVDADADGAEGLAGYSSGYGLVSIPPASLLIDRAHSGDFDVGGLTDFLISQGWTIDELSMPVTTEALAGYDVFLIPSNVGWPGEFSSIDPYTSAEVEAIVAFVEAENGLWCLTEYRHDPSGVNSVANQFGIDFKVDIIVDPVENIDGNQGWPLIQTIGAHPITVDVNSFGYYAGCCVGSESPAVVVATGGPNASSDFCPDYPPVLAVYENNGRAIFCGDSTPLYPGYDISEDHWQLLANIAEWLASGQVIAIESVDWTGVKRLYR